MADQLPRRDLAGAIGSALMVALGGAAWWAAGDFSPLGSVFPRTIGALMVLLGAAYLVLTVMGRIQASAPLDGSNARRLAVAGVMLGWAFALPALGFLASSAAAFALLLVIANHARWTARTALLYCGSGMLVLGALYALFKLALLVPLP